MDKTHDITSLSGSEMTLYYIKCGKIVCCIEKILIFAKKLTTINFENLIKQGSFFINFK